ncbi:MAG: NAD(P)H-dependent oxidoreductase [Eubacterium sp.]|jgi:flavodoxin|uniref:flavodoxin family protein n=1 Tax=Eubacterium sp. F2 TaxID=3381348 RepID=UPI0039082EB5|nr:NAD(P)H-dependent oxidoreductase [Eubacterium sp.]MCI2197687.1 NAD(P)H-dependent oxidoreductase [Eubacterium sp.]
MKSLVVYYSYSGNTRLIAEAIAKAVHADIEELKPEKPIHASGAKYVMWGIRQLVSQSKVKLLPLDHRVEDYDLIIIGTPVWSYTLTPPIRTFLEEQWINNKKIALFCCAGSDHGKTIENMKNALNGNEIIGTTVFYDPLKKDPDADRKKAVEWIRSITR